MTRSPIELSLSLSLIFNDPKEFDDLKEISIESTDFDNPKVYGDTSISDGLVKMVNDENKLSHVVMYFKVKHIIGLIFDSP